MLYEYRGFQGDTLVETIGPTEHRNRRQAIESVQVHIATYPKLTWLVVELRPMAVARFPAAPESKTPPPRANIRSQSAH